MSIMGGLATGVVLAVALASPAFAGGANAAIEGPEQDGRYTVHTYVCTNPAHLSRPNSARHNFSVFAPARRSTTCVGDIHVTAWAEGLVDGKRQTVPIKIEMTGQKGIYRFQRTWPENGKWVIRMNLGPQGPRTPVTVTMLDPKGVARANEVIWEGDGTKECVAFLRGC